MPKDLIEIASKTKYPLEAFLFVQRGLDFTVRKTHGEPDPKNPPAPGTRHVSGRELCMGLRDFAIREYGLMARAVLKRWHVNASEDFGHIVFAMVDSGLMQKTDEDTIHDFAHVFDFNDAFRPALSLKE